MINKAAAKAGFSRRYDYKRYKLTLGFTLVIAGLLLLVSFLASRFAAGEGRPLPGFMKTTVFGQLYLYNMIAFLCGAIVLIIDPRMLIFDGIPSNRWNMYFKSGINAGSLIANKLLFCVCSVLRIYLIGAAGTLLIGLLTRSGDSVTGILDWVLVILLGVCMQLILIMPGVFFGSFLYKRLVISAINLVAAAGLFALLMVSGYTGAQDEAAGAAAVRGMIMPSPTALSLIAFACLVLGAVGAYFFASAKIRSYEVEELDDDELMRLGITRDIVVYERDEDEYSVAISGPELYEVDEELPVPKFETGKNAAKEEKNAADLWDDDGFDV